MPRLLAPAARRSATAVQDKSDARDENLYSSCVVAHGATGKANLFTVPIGGVIPELKASGTTATANAHQTTYAEITTNFEKAGEPGSGIGDGALRVIGVTFEQASYTTGYNSTPGNAQRGFGMTPFEVGDVTSKMVCEILVGRKRQIIGPVWAFPQLGAPMGSLGQSGNLTAAANTVFISGVVNNGQLPLGRKLRTFVQVARDDLFVAALSVGGAAALAFSNAATDGQPSLIWVAAFADVLGDVR